VAEIVPRGRYRRKRTGPRLNSSARWIAPGKTPRGRPLRTYPCGSMSLRPPGFIAPCCAMLANHGLDAYSTSNSMTRVAGAAAAEYLVRSSAGESEHAGHTSTLCAETSFERHGRFGSRSILSPDDHPRVHSRRARAAAPLVPVPARSRLGATPSRAHRFLSVK
jgi:hypothetical protein